MGAAAARAIWPVGSGRRVGAVHLCSRLRRSPGITEVVEEFPQVLVSLVSKSIHGARGATHRFGNL